MESGFGIQSFLWSMRRGMELLKGTRVFFSTKVRLVLSLVVFVVEIFIRLDKNEFSDIWIRIQNIKVPTV